MLMADAGETLRVVTQSERSLDRWRDVLPRHAGVQLDLADDVNDLLALGSPDRRLATLPDAYARIIDEVGALRRLRDAVPMVAELRAEPAEYGLPELPQHDDLHDVQIFVCDGRHLIMDWGDACASHPFFTLSVTVEGVLASGLDDVQDSVDPGPVPGRVSGAVVSTGSLATWLPLLGWRCGWAGSVARSTDMCPATTSRP
ncbi:MULTISPECIES: phosphotransferase [unclassified Solwaraspora]|uniref:phosphotransferase n=1 Tax=unclassified Solwaraspora TaxID=2627926 RepID=UPI00259B1686|nr:phosphotransferase [Solwaraspora sp. WMMA2056]WJK43504.1 phosphotransferase [Solwaraspora sp. WMMA2056]